MTDRWDYEVDTCICSWGSLLTVMEQHSHDCLEMASFNCFCIIEMHHLENK